MTRAKDRQTIPEIPQQILKQRAELQEANRIAGYDLRKVGIPDEKSKPFPPQSALNPPSVQSQVKQQSSIASPTSSATIQTSREPRYQHFEGNGDIKNLSSASDEVTSKPDAKEENHTSQLPPDSDGDTSNLPYLVTRPPFMSSSKSNTSIVPSQTHSQPQNFVQSSLFIDGIPRHGVEYPHQPLMQEQNSNGEVSYPHLGASGNPAASSFEFSAALQPLKNGSLQHSLTQSFKSNEHTQPPAMLSQTSGLELDQNGSMSERSCCGGGNAIDLDPDSVRDNGVYFMSQNAATLDNPMTERRYLKLQSENPWWQQQRTDRKQVVHECRCENCMCTACPVHPFNPVMNQQMQHIARSHPQEMLQLAYESRPLISSAATSNTAYLGFNGYNSGSTPYSNTGVAAFDLNNSRLGSDSFSSDTPQNYNSVSSPHEPSPVFDPSSHSVFQYDNVFTSNDPDDPLTNLSQWNTPP